MLVKKEKAYEVLRCLSHYLSVSQIRVKVGAKF
jgi:hypothetical protein